MGLIIFGVIPLALGLHARNGGSYLWLIGWLLILVAIFGLDFVTAAVTVCMLGISFLSSGIWIICILLRR
jgi:hypothetical protein